MVLREGLLLVGVGVGVGLTGSLVLTSSIRALVFEVWPGDPVAPGAVSPLLTSTALLACYVPANSAARVDPMLALRLVAPIVQLAINGLEQIFASLKCLFAKHASLASCFRAGISELCWPCRWCDWARREWLREMSGRLRGASLPVCLSRRSSPM